MRLLRTTNPNRQELIEFPEESAPEYAILSHTWGSEEVTFQDIQALESRQWARAISQTVSAIRAKKGFIKIQKAAALAAQHGYDFIWVDTCCIDKSSSAELSEAINSMFRWYKKASICYAYLEDVKQDRHDYKTALFHSICQHSRWFTRGWTLQELIASEDVIFYDARWNNLGSKAGNGDVRISLVYITGIDVEVLEGSIQPSEISIATRMKWASRRETTRLEDIAYCLMGLFEVNMPLLYGEGTKAFIRLQEEILKGSNDHSIFTWISVGSSSSEALSGLLADSPRCFTGVENYRPMPPVVSQGSPTWNITNQGLRLSLFLMPCRDTDGNTVPDEYDTVLECAIRDGDRAYQSPAIRMRRLYGDQFARVNSQTIKRVATPTFDPIHGIGAYEIVFVKQKPEYAVSDFMLSYSNILPSSGSKGSKISCYVTKVWPERYWDKEAAVLRTTQPHSNRVIGLFRFFSSSIGATLDFAVGLRKEPGSAWAVWHLQRASMGEPLHQTASSVNGYLSEGNQDFGQFIKSLNNPDPDWVTHPWVEELEYPRIQVRVEEIKVHGRLYHFVKASSVFELQGQSNTPDTSVFNFEKPPMEDEIAQIQKPIYLEDLTDDIVTKNSLDYYLYLGDLMPAKKERSLIRTTWAHSPTEDLEKLAIQGLGATETALLRACKDGQGHKVLGLIRYESYDLECVTLFFCEPYSAIPSQFNGFRPIHWAVVGGHIDIIRILLDNGADFYSRTTQGWSSIHLAALMGRFRTMRWLIEYAIERYSTSYEDESLLDDRDNELQESPLHLAVSHVSLAVGDESFALHDILEKLDVSRFWTSANCAGETPFHRLVATAPVECFTENNSRRVKFIIKKLRLLKCQPEFSQPYLDKLGRTVLWHAVCAGSPPVVEYLLKDDTMVLSMKDKNDVTLLHAACRLGFPEIVDLLLQAGVNPNATTISLGLTAAHYAAMHYEPFCLEELIKHGADIHKPTRTEEISFRPIHVAAANGYWESLSVLRDAGADMEWRCTHYISCGDRFQLVKSDNKNASQLFSLFLASEVP